MQNSEPNNPKGFRSAHHVDERKASNLVTFLDCKAVSAIILP
jgi:hypothetical protein